MSVWDTTTYKLDVAQSIYEYIPFMSSRILGDTVVPYLQPRVELTAIDKYTTWDDVAAICNWTPKAISEQSQDDIVELTKHVTSWSLGVGAIYKLIHASARGKFAVAPQYDYRSIDARAHALGTVVCASTQVTPRSFHAAWSKVDRATREYSRQFDDFSEAWKYASRDIDYKADEFTMLNQDKYFKAGSRLYYGGYIGKLIILVGSASYRNRGLILTRAHLSILIEASAKICNLLDHCSREYADDPVMLERTRQILEMTIDSAGKSREHNVDKVAQAYHKARAYMQMMLFKNVMNNSEEDALLEFQKKGLQNIMDLGAYIASFDGVPRARWLELLNVYKWLPPPDFDSTYAFQELYDCHNAARMSGLDAGASKRMKKLWKLVVKERKLNIATAYRKMNGTWPTGLVVHDDVPDEESIDAWEPKSLFPYFTYGTDVTSQIKDRTTVLSRMRDEVYAKDKSRDRNFLLWYLANRDFIDTKVDARRLMNGTLPEDNYVRVAYKGEAHKPGSRLFFMAPPRQRILLGELEGNISRLAKFYPASLQGMDALARAAKLANLFNVNDESFVSGVDLDHTCYVVTFDLSKFSTKFSPSVLANLHDFWADVFGYRPIKAMLNIGSYSTILHTTNNLVMSYSNKGADLEGFRGRMMTLFHADLISAACRLAKDAGYIVGKAISAVFIDDGAVRIAAKGQGVVAEENARKFLECMQDIYEAAGQENHPNKTIVSKLGGELLSEQFLSGLKLKCPIKAGMRLYPKYENPASCITEEFDAMFSTIQGSIKDGCQWVVAYRRYADAFLKAINRWDRAGKVGISDVMYAFKVVTPKSFGGFGFPTLQALTTTAAFNITVEGLGILNSAARMFPKYEPIVYAIMDRRVVRRDPIHVLRDGERVRLEGTILVEGRLLDKLVQKLTAVNSPVADLMLSFTSPELVEHARQVANALLSEDSVSLPVFKRAWNSTPLAYVEGIVQKFQRSASITMVLNERDISQIRRQNQRDVHKIVREPYRY